MKRSMLFVSMMMMAALLLQACGDKPTRDELQVQLNHAQQARDSEAAVAVYESIARYYPEGEDGAKAQFMVGYIYANDLGDTAKARDAYETFISRYEGEVDSALILSAKLEIGHSDRAAMSMRGFSTSATMVPRRRSRSGKSD